MRRLLWVAAVLSGVGCAAPDQKTCSNDRDCAAPGFCKQGLCFYDDDAGTGGGGGGGGAAMGGGTGGGGGPVGGGTGELTGLVFESPDAGARTNASSIAVALRSFPANASVISVQYALALSDGGTFPGGELNNSGGNLWTQMLTGVGEGEWTLTARSGGIDASVVFTVDRTGPRLTVEAPAHIQYGTASATFIPADGDGGAFRKDETIQVRVTSPDLDFSSATLKAHFAASAPVTVSTSSDCGDGGVACRLFSVDLSQLAMPAFRGPVTLSAVGVDNVGNAQTIAMDTTIDVTRWQWALRVDSVNAIVSTPAIGTGGRVFVGTALGGGMPSGQVIAVNPDGGMPWNPTNSGPTGGPIAVAKSLSDEYVFFQGSLAPGTVRSIALSSWTVGPQPCAGGNSGNINEAGLAVFSENTGEVAALGVQAANTASRGILLVPETQGCLQSTATLNRLSAPGNIAATSRFAAVVGSNGNLRVMDYDGGSPVLRSIDQPVGSGVGTVTGLAMLSSTRVAGGGGPGVGRFFAFDIGATSATNAWSGGPALSTPTSGPVVSDDGVFGVIQSAAQKSQLIRLSPMTGAELARTAELSGSSFSMNAAPSPVLGTNGKIYVIDEMGALFVVSANFTANAQEEWQVTLPMQLSATVTASPTLDCNRRNMGSQTGVLYIATQSGWLISYLVDSPGGLDRSAPWPKYARDSRNTGNFDGPAIGCP